MEKELTVITVPHTIIKVTENMKFQKWEESFRKEITT